MAESPSTHDELQAPIQNMYRAKKLQLKKVKAREKSQPKQPRDAGRRRPRARGPQWETLSAEDARLAARVANDKARIRGLNLDSSHRLLERCLTRDPSLFFDIMDETSRDPPMAPPGSPSTWCISTNCRNMPLEIENKSCQQLPQFCILKLPQMDVYILQEGVLRLARHLLNAIRAITDLPYPGEGNRELRYAANRQYVVWKYGALGRGHRVVIPSCCVWRIRDKYPDPHGQYTGFFPTRIQLAVQFSSDFTVNAKVTCSSFYLHF